MPEIDENIKQRKHNDKLFTWLALFCQVILVPLLIGIGFIFLDNQYYYAVSVGIVILSIIGMALSFEFKKPKAQEIVTLTAMTAIAVASRVAFYMIPQFKPVAAIVIISGIALGGQSGFMVGAMAAFLSNFMFGQGPWTPWQMFAFGLIGLLAGAFGQAGSFSKKRIPICLFGGLSVFIVYGFIMDTYSVFTMLGTLNAKAILSMYVAGMPFNLIHAISTVVFLAILAKPMIEKLERLKSKFGLFNESSY